ncbi:MAG: hypothetical protein AAB575_00835 [Patescibacteria group bacterium]
MKNNSDKNLEEVIDEALLLRDQGKSEAEIFKKFSEQANDLQEIFKAIEIMDAQKDKFAPSESLLRKILAALPGDKVANVKESFFAPIFSFFEWQGLPYAVAVATFLLVITFGFNWYNAPKGKVDVAVTEQEVSFEKSAEENAAEIKKDTMAIEKNVDSLKNDLNNFEKELSEIEKLASDESLKNLDSLLSQIDGEIM